MIEFKIAAYSKKPRRDAMMPSEFTDKPIARTSDTDRSV
jgi:hypothetical protein